MRGAVPSAGGPHGEMLKNCYDEADEEFGRFVEHFGRGKSDRELRM